MTDYLVRMDTADAARVSFGSEWTIGHTGGTATWTFQLPIDETAATIRFDTERYEVAVAGEPPRHLRSGDTITLGPLVLRFLLPHPWTPTGVLLREAGPRSDSGADRLVLAAGPVLLGAGDSHVAAHDADETVTLFETADERPERSLAWKLVSGPLDGHRVNRLTLPTFLETDTLRAAIEPA